MLQSNTTLLKYILLIILLSLVELYNYIIIVKRKRIREIYITRLKMAKKFSIKATEKKKRKTIMIYSKYFVKKKL